MKYGLQLEPDEVTEEALKDLLNYALDYYSKALSEITFEEVKTMKAKDIRDKLSDGTIQEVTAPVYNSKGDIVGNVRVDLDDFQKEVSAYPEDYELKAGFDSEMNRLWLNDRA